MLPEGFRGGYIEMNDLGNVTGLTPKGRIAIRAMDDLGCDLKQAASFLDWLFDNYMITDVNF